VGISGGAAGDSEREATGVFEVQRPPWDDGRPALTPGGGGDIASAVYSSIRPLI
jgi:hypothetical protein